MLLTALNHINQVKRYYNKHPVHPPKIEARVSQLGGVGWGACVRACMRAGGRQGVGDKGCTSPPASLIGSPPYQLREILCHNSGKKGFMAGANNSQSMDSGMQKAGMDFSARDEATSA